MVGSDGKALGDVFVYVKDGLGNYVYDAPATPAKIDQQNCRYHPHVFGMRVGQPLVILNSDPTLHNIHALPKSNAEFNTGQPIQGMKTTHTFDKPEVMPFKCDVHGWMNVNGRARSSVARGHGQKRQVRSEDAAAGQLRSGVARKLGADSGSRLARRGQGHRVHLQAPGRAAASDWFWGGTRLVPCPSPPFLP